MMSENWSLELYLEQRCELVDAALNSYLPAPETLPDLLHEAMRYSVFAGGKRIRPILLLAACEALGGDVAAALPAACAIEMIHSYSLIHDDLPAMDDDDLRRGKPTSHKVYGEAMAILAGDALLTEAFVLLSNPEVMPTVDAQGRCRLIHLLAKSSGSRGMVGGQVVDMESEERRIDLPTLEYIHTHKTGALILAAIEMGAIIGGADEGQLRALSRYGATTGLAFQIADDILDIVADQNLLGKDVGSDQERGKATYPALMGLKAARRRKTELFDLAQQSLEPFGSAGRPLREIAEFIVNREY
jgi:geranylgeranyl diphosphate synthase type II